MRVATAIAIAAALGAGCSKSEPAAGGGGFMGGPVPVLIAQAVEKTVPIQLNAIGSVEAYSTVSVRSQIDGKIAEIHFHEGEDVKKGDLLSPSTRARSKPNCIRPRPISLATVRNSRKRRLTRSASVTFWSRAWARASRPTRRTPPRRRCGPP